MGQFPEIQFNGTSVTTTRVNLRQGSPSTSAPILRKLEAGTIVDVLAITVGESVAGNAHWFRTDNSAFVWAGGCSAPKPIPVPSPIVASVVSPVVRVVDISHGDAVSSFADARADGLWAVIHKATTGATGRDDAYRSRRGQAQAAGLLWGAYHWGTGFPVKDQVDNFLSWAQPDDKTLVALDFESTPGNQMTLEMAQDFLQSVIDRLGRRAVVYSGDTIRAALGQSSSGFFGSHRLWLASYGNHPTVQASWSNYWLWQYSDGESGPDPKRVRGIPGDSKSRLDCDYFAGTEEELDAQWSASQ